MGIAKSRILAKLAVLVLAFMHLAAAPARADALPDIPYMVIEPASGTVLAANRIDERWHPASLTKLMTAYVTFRAIEAGEIAAGSPVTVTANARRVPPSRMGYAEGTVLRVDNALAILIVKSANDVSIALAESVAGSVPAFVARMNDAARELGLSDTRFVNPNGLHEKDQYSTARDLVVLSRAIWNGFPQYRNLFETAAIKAGDAVHYSYNLLLERFPGTTGMKTGFVCASGYNIVASAERGGRRLVAVVLGADSQTERAVTAARLLTEGYAASSGRPIATLQRPASATGPVDQRPRICSQAAREARYDPLPQTARIVSPWLEERKPSGNPIVIAAGGVDAPPSDAWLARAFMPDRVPLPEPRPDYQVVNLDGETPSSADLLRTTIPVPLESPLTRSN